MTEKNIKSRIVHKHNTEAHWDLAENFTPKQGEIIVYDIDDNYNYERFKIGDGKQTVTALPFADNTKADKVHSHNLDEIKTTKAPFVNIDGENLEDLLLSVDGELSGKAAASHGTHVTAATVKSALGTSSGTTKYLREDGNWAVPPDTDTNTTYDLAAAKSKSNGNVTIDLTAGGSGSGTDSVKIKGSGATTVTTDANGIITISSTDTNSETTLTITDKDKTDDADLVYAVTNLEEGGTKGHVITPTYTGLPTKAYVDKMVTGTVEYLGTVSALTGLSTTAGKGDFYRVSTQFAFGSEAAHVGDILLATKDNPTRNATDWDLIHTEVDSNTWVENKVSAAGYVTAPGASNANKVWKTDNSGNPGWRDDANTHNSHAVISGKKADGSTDIKGSASSGDITLGDSGVTAGEYGPTSDQTPGYGATFNVPDIKVNSKGIVTSVTNRTVTIPAIDNLELITVDDIDTICGTVIQVVNSTSEVTF